jgi:hypothetical protein
MGERKREEGKTGELQTGMLAPSAGKRRVAAVETRAGSAQRCCPGESGVDGRTLKKNGASKGG